MRDDLSGIDVLRARMNADVAGAGGIERVLPPLEEPPYDQACAEVALLPASSINPEPVRWLWPGWLARGKLHLLAGRPGQGKTQLALALAAAVTRPGRWPDGTRCEAAGSVVIWSGEDDPADTLVPRLIAAGADRDRVLLVGPVAEGSTRRPFDPAFDLPLLADKLRLLRPAMLIVDPIVSATAADTHKNGEVRRALQPLVDLAAQIDCALIGITHLSKGTAGRDPVERLNGSIAFGALARIVWIAVKREDPPPGEPSRLLVRAKSNIGADAGGIGYDIEQVEAAAGIWTSRVLWGAPLEGSARELLAQAEAVPDDGDGGTLADACGFLRALLEDGPMSQKQLMAEARAAGYSEATIRRAKQRLRIEAVKSGFGRSGTWVWSLPAAKDDQATPKMLKPETLSILGQLEHLSEPAPVPDAKDDQATPKMLKPETLSILGQLEHLSEPAAPADAAAPPAANPAKAANHAPLADDDVEAF